MGDIAILSLMEKVKDGGSSSINCLMLTLRNYTVGAIRMKILLKVHKAWDMIEKEPDEFDRNDMDIALITGARLG